MLADQHSDLSATLISALTAKLAAWREHQARTAGGAADWAIDLEEEEVETENGRGRDRPCAKRPTAC